MLEITGNVVSERSSKNNLLTPPGQTGERGDIDESNSVEILASQLAASQAEIERLGLEIRSSKEQEAIYVERLEASGLAIVRLEGEISSLKAQTLPVRFTIGNIKDDNDLVRFYTGLPSYGHFCALADFLKDCSSSMSLWAGTLRATVSSIEFGRRARRLHRRTLPLDDELPLTLMKLRMDASNQDLAIRFAISASAVSRIFTTWVMLLYSKLKKSAGLSLWPRKNRIMQTMPQQFMDLYPSTRVIIDCTEIPIEVPFNPDAQRVTWSTYKNRNTVKALVGITPGSVISFCHLCMED